MNKQSIAVKEQAIALKKSREQCISSVKDICGKNCEYFSADKCVYYSPNRKVPNKKKLLAVENNLPDLYRAMKQFKAENPGEKVKIVKV